MLHSNLIRRLTCIRIFARNKTDTPLNLETLEQESAASLDVIDDEVRAREEELERKRNKSRLRSQHYNVVHGKPPYNEPIAWYQGTLKYNRKMYAQYGQESGVNPALCWPTEQELDDKKEYEKIAYPFTIPEMMADAKHKREEKQNRAQARQEEIVKKMEKLEQWKKELHNKVFKKENEALVAKERRERLVEEVRRHFGYTVDPRDEKFKEMLEKKEKEQKKAMKMAKKQAKEERMIASLLSKNVEEPQTETSDKTEPEEKNLKE